MSAITIRKLPDDAKQRLRMRAAAKGRSMESEAREILLSSLEAPSPVDLTWVEKLIALGDEMAGVELDISKSEAVDYDELARMFDPKSP